MELLGHQLNGNLAQRHITITVTEEANTSVLDKTRVPSQSCVRAGVRVGGGLPAKQPPTKIAPPPPRKAPPSPTRQDPAANAPEGCGNLSAPQQEGQSQLRDWHELGSRPAPSS